jgi:cob(I)alamin adenosyltransferase
MKIYTKTGDKGKTSLVYGERVSKEDARVEAYGTCDEANSVIGLGISELIRTNWVGMADVVIILRNVQTVLFHVGAELATPTGKEVKWEVRESDIVALETEMDKWDKELPPLANFILPGGHVAGATFHLARTVVRRAERRAVSIGEEVNPLVVAYLNRLSDFLFMLARYVNHHLSETEPTLHQ